MINKKDEIELRNILKEMIKMNMKPNFAALGRKFGCDHRTIKNRYFSLKNKELDEKM